VSQRTTPPFRADHVGSLLRPPQLLRARDDFAGEISVKFFNPEGEIEFTPAALHVDGKLGVSRTIFGDDFTFLNETVTTNVPKLTIPSPSMVHYRGGKAAIDPAVYPDLDAFWADLTAATGKRCAGSATSAARTSSSTTRASRT
jgi:methionine synthase II (cobalamin-independent)